VPMEFILRTSYMVAEFNITIINQSHPKITIHIVHAPSYVYAFPAKHFTHLNPGPAPLPVPVTLSSASFLSAAQSPLLCPNPASNIPLPSLAVTQLSSSP